MFKRNAAKGVLGAAIFVLGTASLPAVSASNIDEAIREHVSGHRGSAVSQPDSAGPVSRSGSNDAQGDSRNPFDFLGHTWTADAGTDKLIRDPYDQFPWSSTYTG